MPVKNNRNSRDDKSKKFNSSKPSRSSSSRKPKPEKPEFRDKPKEKLFSEDKEGGVKKSFKRSDENSQGGEKREPKNAGPSRKTFAGKSSGFRKDFDPTKPKRDFSSKEGSNERPRRSEGGSFTKPRPTGTGYRKFDDPEKPRWSYEERVSKGNIRPKKQAPQKDDGLIRLNRYIANAGICSRRKADELIAAGVVSVNGTVVSELGHKVDPGKDVIRYNGETLKREKSIYVLLNKPKDYITTTEDPQERRTVMHLVEKASRERIYPVGRLDRNTTGLLLMTNDGDLADKLSHPRNSVTKIYNVELNKSLTQGDLNKIEYGLELEDGLIKPDAISYVQGGSKREVGIQIHTGKNRIVRRIFEHLGYEVVKLDRVIYGNLTKKDLPRGRWRYLEEKEIIQLKHLIK